jgi:hypothetical protein
VLHLYPAAKPARRGLARCGLGLALCLLACPKLSETAEDAPEEEGSAPRSESEQRVDQLERSELQSLCQDLNTELSTRFDNRRLVTYECTRRYIQSGDTLSCNLNVDDCLRQASGASLAAPRPADYQIDNAECANIGTCRVSVGVFDTCIGDRFEQSDQLMARVSCSLANDPRAVEELLRQVDAPRRLPQSCTEVAASCPGIL